MARTSKTRTMMRHAKMRAMERFDIDLNKELHGRIKSKIGSGEFPLIFRQSCRVGLYQAEMDGKRPIIVYDKIRRIVVTFLFEQYGEF